VIRYGGQFAGELTVWRIDLGASRSAEVGYWIDPGLAGRGIMPAALAMGIDHCFQAMGLHRVEAGIQPENAASRRVVEKLGFRNEGTRVRLVCIEGAWRDHVCYAITAEEAQDGLLPRWRGECAPLRAAEPGSAHEGAAAPP
jgi:ribosomal-protein-alanine N-acetyltransferase